MFRTRQIFSGGWQGSVVSAFTDGYYPFSITVSTIGKVCAALSMRIPSMTIAMGPSMAIAMDMPGLNATMTTTDMGVELTTPGATIEMECCD